MKGELFQQKDYENKWKKFLQNWKKSELEERKRNEILSWFVKLKSLEFAGLLRRWRQPTI